MGVRGCNKRGVGKIQTHHILSTKECKFTTIYSSFSWLIRLKKQTTELMRFFESSNKVPLVRKLNYYCFSVFNGWKLLTIITKHSILDVAAALDPSLFMGQSWDTCVLISFTSYFCSKINKRGTPYLLCKSIDWFLYIAALAFN